MAAQRRTPTLLPVPCDVLLALGAQRRTGRSDRRSCDVLLARLATRQHGVVGREQLVALGFSRQEIGHRLGAGRLIRIHRGVYAAGHEALSDRGRMIAGLLAAGDGAVLSHRTAAHLWRLIPSAPPLVEVTLSDRRPRARHGLLVHHASSLETQIHQRLPVTTPLRTVADLRGDEADRARAEALVRRLIPRTADDAAEPTRSELERRLVRALAAAGLPRPLVNHRVAGYELDFVWPEHRVVVETDGWATHGNRRAFERDHARDAALAAGGYAVLRFTWRQVVDETLKATVQIAQVIARRTPHHALDHPPPGG